MNVGQEHLHEDILRLLCDEQWSNNACCGYVLIACRTLGYSEKQINELLSALNDAFGNFSVERAKEKYLHR